MQYVHRGVESGDWRRSLPIAMALIGLISGGVVGCQAPGSTVPAVPSAGGRAGGLAPAPTIGNADEFLVVDCLLPARVKRLGRQLTYLGARRPLRTSAVDCEIRGGEYVAYDRADYRTALAIWTATANEGDPKAQNYVGEIYERGLGTIPDHQSAAQWYELAAVQGFAPAQINLGQLYERGLGVTRDQVQAINWYRRAAGLEEAGLAFVESADVATEFEVLRRETEALEGQVRELERQLQEDATSAGTAEGEQVAQERAKLAAEREELEREREDLASQLEVLRRETGALEGQVRELERQLQETATSVATAEREQLAQERAKLVAESDELERERELAVEERTALDARHAEIEGREDEILESLLGNDEADRYVVAIAELQEQIESKNREWDTLIRDASLPSSAPLPPIALGNFYALVIGNVEYQHLGKLETSIRDAEAITILLSEKYGFEVTLLRNANRYQILSALNEFREKLGEQDNLLIYYAGHGQVDSMGIAGHWLPVDAKADDPTSWISNAAVADILEVMHAQRIIVIADSLYSELLSRNSLSSAEAGAADERLAWVRAVADQRSRTALSSGGVAPEPDGASGRHSVFADALLEVLSQNEGLIEGQRVHQEILTRVTGYSDDSLRQMPKYAPIKYAGHEGGEFFLAPQSARQRLAFSQ